MTALVSIDTDRGELRRYETGGTKRRLTHEFHAEAPLPSMPPSAIESFRRNPDLCDYVGAPITPTDPGAAPTPAAGTPPLMQIAA